MSLLTLPRGIAALLESAVPGRRHRRSWSGGERAHIEVRAVHLPGHEDLASDLERALGSLHGVRWAEVNALTSRVVIALDPEDGPDLDDLVEVVDGLEEAHGVKGERFPSDRPEHPGDVEPIRRNAVVLAADILGIGASVLAQAIALTPVPGEIAAIVSLVDNEPRIRHLLEHRAGPQLTDIGLALTNALAQALGQGPLGLVVDVVHRASIVSELTARRSVWQRREPELAGARYERPLEALAYEPRPEPLRAGPIEAYADRAALGSLGAFSVALGVTRRPRHAGNVLAAGVAKPARLGREVFAAHFGAALARRGAVVLDSHALRRLDRVEVVVLDAGLLSTGRFELAEVEALGDEDPRQLATLAVSLFDPTSPRASCQRDEWRLGPLDALDATAPRGALSRSRVLGKGHAGVVAMARNGMVVALGTVDAQLDPLAKALAAATRRAGVELVVAGRQSGLGARLHADRSMPGGRRLDESVRLLQAGGGGVLLVAGGGQHRALSGADCAIGVPEAGHHPPWGADVITGPGLAHAHLVIEALPAARRVDRRSVQLSLAGSSAGALWSIAGPLSGAGHRASIPVNAAALVSEANAILSGSYAGRRAAPPPDVAPPWHAMDSGRVLSALGATASGLDPAEVARRRPKHAGEEPLLERFARAMLGELANPLTPLLAAGAGLAAAVGSVTDAALVAGVTGMNAVIGAVQRLRTEVLLDRLREASVTDVGVRRSGGVLRVPRDELVPGDVVELSAGDLVPADSRILEALALEVDESSLSGESFPVAKSPAPTPATTLGERAGMLYEGTTVVSGTAVAVVVAVGESTEMGRTLAELPEPPSSGVEARLSALTRAIVPATIASGALVTGLSILRGRAAREAVSSGVSLAVAAVPEGLPLLATVAQLGAARRLSGRNALVRNPRTIEALGRVDLLCFDKTGTLTEGHIALQRITDGLHEEPLDRLTGARRSVLAAALRASPALEPDAERVHHATDQAVLDAADHAGVVPGDDLGGWSLVSELAFESERGFHAVVGSSPSGPRMSVKGAPEVVLPRCSSWASPQGSITLDRAFRLRLELEVERLARSGLRVLAVAERASAGRPDLDEDRVENLELLGFLGLSDKIRQSAAGAVTELRRAGVDVVMITGDHPSTAEAIAAELGILDGKAVMTRRELDALDDSELAAAIGGVSVFARVTPAHKARLVRAFQGLGRAVAMTGDGANDAAAIRLADTGIALGMRGSSAAREAADLVVTDDRIETIVDAIVEGRAMWASVRDALAILVGGNLGEVAFSVAATVVTGASPLGARQLLLVNLLTDLLPAMTIALRPPGRVSPESLLEEGPDASLGAELARQVALRALTSAAGAGGAFLIARPIGSARRASTVSLAALVGTQLAQTAVLGRTSPLVLASTLASSAVLVGVVQTPGVSQFFGCTPLDPLGWGIALGTSALAAGASAVLPWAYERVTRPDDQRPEDQRPDDQRPEDQRPED